MVNPKRSLANEDGAHMDARVWGPKETVNHPPHYGGDTVYEVIKVIEAWGLAASFCLGNVIKYVARAPFKGNTLEDLKKARWYLDHEIQRMEKSVKESGT